MTRIVFILLCGFAWLHADAFAGPAKDLSEDARNRFNQAAQGEGAAAANAMVQLLTEASAQASQLNAPKTNEFQMYDQNLQRRQFHVLMHDIQDHIGKMSSPEAQAAFATAIGRAPPHVAECILFGQRAAPAHEGLDAAAVKLIKPGTNFKVRVGAMELVTAHKYAAAIDAIITQLSEKENPAVQITACRSLGKFADAKSVTALIKYLGSVGKGRYQFEACSALRALSGQKFGADASTWKGWWEKEQANFKPEGGGTPTLNYELSENSDQMYYEIPVVENRLVFVFDVSKSMIYGGTPNRLEKAKSELKEFIKRLRPTQNFNIIPFSTFVSRWQNTPSVAANDQYKTLALKYVDSLTEQKGTQTTTALEDALNFVATAYGCETIFLVTDGAPNPWNIYDPASDIDQQLRHITWMNQALKVRINCVGIYTRVPGDESKIPGAPPEKPAEMKRFLQELAKANDGAYKEIP